MEERNGGEGGRERGREGREEREKEGGKKEGRGCDISMLRKMKKKIITKSM